MKVLLPLLATALLLAPLPAPARPAAPPARFAHGMVSAADPRAAEAGARMLRAGGSAADAALAMLLALNVVEPQSSGIGGGGYALVDDGRGHVASFDGRETAPAAADGTWFYNDGQPLTVAQAIPGGRSVGVPGNVALMAAIHARYGRLAWGALFTPAIALARDGFTISPRLHEFLTRFSKTGALSPAARALYYQADGTALPAGTRVRDPALAGMLAAIAARGPAAFYHGANAQAIAASVRTAPRNPAPMRAADLAAYAAKPRPPVCLAYRRYRVCGMGPSSSGATTVLGMLGLLERFDLSALGKDNPVSWHLIAEAMRLTYADRDRYLADSDFVPVPVAGLLSKSYLAQRSALISPDRTLPEASAGTPPGAVAEADTLTPFVPATTHFVAIDRAGEAASVTSTIESPFGSGLMVSGYYLNNELTDFSLVPERDGRPVANRVEGGKRPRSAMSPTLVYGPDGRLRLALGAAGGATIPAQVLRVIIGVIDWHLPVEEALALPVLFAPGGERVLLEADTPLAAMAPALTRLGHKDVEAWHGMFKANAIEIRDGGLVGGADPRSEGRAIRQ
ncbi:MAG: gamma-glutamyltransferase [Sphingomonadales bacterium]|nr:gamma-glutamyltransferase [Sphingomonadales bacterium]